MSSLTLASDADCSADIGPYLATMSTNPMQPPPKPPRKKKAPTLRDSDWEPYRTRLTELYNTQTTLKQIRKIMEDDYNFHAEIRQYKSRISKWNLDKNIKPKEMKAIVRKKLERKLLEPDRPEYSFRIRGVEVDSSKIDRWIHAHGVSESTPYSTSSRASTPSAVACRTISELGSPLNSIPSPALSYNTDTSGSSSDLPSSPPTWVSNSFRLKIWNIWNGFFRRQYQTQDCSSMYDQAAHCRKITGELLAGCEPVERRSLAYVNLLLLPGIHSMNIVSEGLEDVLQYWLELGVDINHGVGTAQTPLIGLQWSQARGLWRLILLLIKHGADIHAVDKVGGYGLLHTALRSLDIFGASFWVPLGFQPHAAEVETRLIILLEAGCDANAKNFEGKSPPEIVTPNGIASHIWTQALARVEYRKSLNADERDADLLSWAPPARVTAGSEVAVSMGSALERVTRRL